MKSFFLFGLLASCIALSACSKESSREGDAEEGGNVSTAQQSAQQDIVQQNQNARPQPSAQQQPPLQQPPTPAQNPAFQPGVDDVRFAFTTAFLMTYSKIPKTPANEKWALAEQQKIVDMRVHECSVSSRNVPSTCRITFNGSSATVKVMLTQMGWAIVL